MAKQIEFSDKSESVNEIDETVKLINNNLSKIYFRELINTESHLINGHNKLNNFFITEYFKQICHDNKDNNYYVSNLFLKNYGLLSSLDRGYVNITSNDLLISDDWCYYGSMKFNFDKQLCRQIIEQYINPEDFGNVIVAGGFFSKYCNDDQRFNDLHQVLKSEQDIDIFAIIDKKKYIKQWESTNYEFYSSK